MASYVQEGKRIFDKGDVADEKLFSGVSPDVWQKRTFLIFYHLLVRLSFLCKIVASAASRVDALALARFPASNDKMPLLLFENGIILRTAACGTGVRG